MKFKMMLWTLGLRLEQASKKNPELQQELEGRSLVLQFETMDERVARHFVIDGSRVKSVKGRHSGPDMRLRFKDEDFATQILTSGSRLPFMEGVQRGDIVTEGDASLLTWFFKLGRHVSLKKKPSTKKKSSGSDDEPSAQ